MLRKALQEGELVFTTGLILQELLQGFRGTRARDRIVEDFSVLPLVVPDRSDHIEAAALRNTCRRRGLEIGTIDALLAQLCLRHELTLLTTDADFARMTSVCPLALWTA
jgi:predicted nucleic acid-binding protein